MRSLVKFEHNRWNFFPSIIIIVIWVNKKYIATEKMRRIAMKKFHAYNDDAKRQLNILISKNFFILERKKSKENISNFIRLISLIIHNESWRKLLCCKFDISLIFIIFSFASCRRQRHSTTVLQRRKKKISSYPVICIMKVSQLTR